VTKLSDQDAAMTLASLHVSLRWWTLTTVSVVVLVSQCRQSCFQSSLWGEVVVTSAKGEPPFPTQALLMVLLLLVVVVISQVVMYAFWTANVRSRSVGQGKRQQRCRVGHVDGASVHSPVPVATTSGTTTVGLAFSGAH
jgi:hypothetical protein